MEKVDQFTRSFQYNMNKTTLAHIDTYLRNGDERILLGIKPDDIKLGWLYASNVIATPSAFDPVDQRILRVLLHARAGNVLAPWIDRVLEAEPHTDPFAVLTELAKPLKMDATRVLNEALSYIDTYQRDGAPTAAGRRLCTLDTRALTGVIATTGSAGRVADLFNCLKAHAPRRIRDAADGFLAITYCDSLVSIMPTLLQHDRGLFEPKLAWRAKAERDVDSRFKLYAALAEFDAAKYNAAALTDLRTALAAPQERHELYKMLIWAVERFGAAAVPDLLAYFARTDFTLHSWGTAYRRQIEVLDAAARLGAAAIPVCHAALRIPDGEVQYAVIGHLLATGDPAQRPVIVEVMRAGLRGTDTKHLARVLLLAAREGIGEVEADAWALLKHKSVPVRQAAVLALAQIAADPVSGAVRLLAEKKADPRLAAVWLLAAVGTPPALQALEAHLESEDNDDIREAILGALQAVWAATGRRITRADIEARLPEKIVAPAAWLAQFVAPEVRDTDGVPLGGPLVAFMLARQARIGEMRPSLELAPLYALIDRRSGADFALALTQAFIAGAAEAKDRWVLAIAGLLGDDRVVTLLGKQISAWADAGRGKLAEYAVQALALLGSDAALTMVDAMTLRFRTKNKNIGTAAAEAFAAAAERVGVTVEELGDRVIPWLDFTPGQPRLVPAGGKTLELRIGLDGKPAFRDAATGKKATLPGSAPAELKAELKTFAELLKEVVKGQVARLEVLMVRQYRWPADRWQELFLRHPVMVPFGVRLVWGVYEHRALTGTFRALEDGSLTDADDNTVTLPDTAAVGIVHPLELDPASRDAWQSSLADYEVEPPFAQLARPVVTATPEQAGEKFYRALTGTSINAMTFRGRAEKLGWRRGSVCDGGGVTTYVKYFPAAGADALLQLDGMYIGIDMYTDITLQDAYFVRGGSVQIGSYTYDEPSNADDPRLLTFANVPPIVYSEVIADLQRIGGDKVRG